MILDLSCRESVGIRNMAGLNEIGYRAHEEVASFCQVEDAVPLCDQPPHRRTLASPYVRTRTQKCWIAFGCKHEEGAKRGRCSHGCQMASKGSQTGAQMGSGDDTFSDG